MNFGSSTVEHGFILEIILSKIFLSKRFSFTLLDKEDSFKLVCLKLYEVVSHLDYIDLLNFELILFFIVLYIF